MERKIKIDFYKLVHSEKAKKAEVSAFRNSAIIAVTTISMLVFLFSASKIPLLQEYLIISCYAFCCVILFCVFPVMKAVSFHVLADLENFSKKELEQLKNSFLADEEYEAAQRVENMIKNGFWND